MFRTMDNMISNILDRLLIFFRFEEDIEISLAILKDDIFISASAEAFVFL